MPTRRSLRLPLAVAAAYALWYCALFSPILFGHLLFPSDGQLAAFFTPIRLWNPLPLAGMPGLAEPHLAQLYPVRWLFAALPEAFGFNAFVVFSYALASSLTFGYAYTVTGSKLAAGVAGLAFGTSGYLIAHLGHTGMFAAVAWMPLTFWSLERLRQAPAASWFAIASVSIALTILAGHPQVFAYSIYLGAAYAVFLGTRAATGWTRYVLIYLAAVAVGGAIAAAHLLPALELAQLSVRSELTFEAFKEYALPLRQLPTLLFPYLFGGGFPPTFIAYFGQWNLSETASYAGLLTLMAAALGVVGARKNPLVAFWLGAALVSFLLVLGDATPLLRVTYHLPVIGKLRAPARHLQETTFALAVLASFGVRALQTGAIGQRAVQGIVAMAAVILAATLASILLFYDHLATLARAAIQALPPPSANPALWIPCVVFVVSALALLTWARKPASRPRSAALIAALAIDLASNARFAEWRYGTHVAQLDIAPYARRYRDELVLDHQRVMPMLGWQEPLLAFSTAMSQLYDMPSVGGYGPLLQQRYAGLSKVTNGGWIDPAVLRPDDRAPDLLAARFIVAPRGGVPFVSAHADASRFAAANLPIALGAGCSTSGARQLRLAIPQGVTFDEVGIVTTMACSTGIAQGDAVARLSLIDGAGHVHERMLRAGKDTAEWAIDCPDVRSAIRHGVAPVFESWDVTRAGVTCRGHRYVSAIAVEPAAYREIVVDWLAAAPATLRIWRMSVIDSASKHAYHVGDDDPLFADPSHFRHVEDIGTSAIYRNERAMPRAWLVPRVVVARPDEILRAVHTSLAPDGSVFDPRDVAFVEEPVDAGSPQPSDAMPLRTAAPLAGAQTGSAVVTQLTSDRVDIVTRAAQPAFLVSSDVDYPGWTASIDGVETKMFRTNYALRGVAVPSGDHTVVFRYRPRAFFIGLAVSLATLAGLAAFLVYASRKR